MTASVLASLAVTATVKSIQPVVLYGVTMLAHDENFVTLRIKRPRSSKYFIRVVPVGQILAVYGQIGEEGGTNVTLLSEVDVMSVTGVITDSDANSITIQDADGNPATIKTNDPSLRVEILADDLPAEETEETAPEV